MQDGRRTGLSPVWLGSCLLPCFCLFGTSGGEELFFQYAKVAMTMEEPDSITVEVTAVAEDFMNTVNVFPVEVSDTAKLRLFESRLESYLRIRIPVWVDGRRIPLAAVKAKPEGKRGKGEGLDSASILGTDHTIRLGGKLPAKRSRLEVQADLWVERPDASGTMVEFSLRSKGLVLRRTWAGVEKKLRFPVSPDSIEAMRSRPPDQKESPPPSHFHMD